MSHLLHFYKMHALGNDFMVVNGIQESASPENLPIVKLANRHTGVGFDQLLWLGSSKRADFSCRFFNADGSEAEQCGNGVRCIARFIHEQKLSQKKDLSLETRAGIVSITLEKGGFVKAAMGVPLFQSIEHLMSDEKPLTLFLVSLGNPHAILLVPSIEDPSLSTLGKKIATHALFKEGINVGFMQILNRQSIRLRTYERGVGETLACGSNACAAVASGIKENQLDVDVTVHLPLGQLHLSWEGNSHPIYMQGPTEMVFEGKISI